MRTFFLLGFLFLAQIISAQKTNYQSLIIDSQLTKNANAVVRSDEMTIHLVSKNEMNISVKKVVTVLNKYGDKSSQSYAGYDDGRKMKKIQAIVYDRLGKEKEKFREKDFTDVSAVDGSTLYSDSRVKYLNYTPTEYPYTIEFIYEMTTSNTGELAPAWYFLFGFLVSTEQSKISILFDSPELKPEVMERNLTDVDFKKEITENSIIYEAKNIMAIKDESLSPVFSKITPKLKIRPISFSYGGYDASIKDWKDLGSWMHNNLLKGRDELPESTISKIKALVKNVDDDLEKAKIVYKFVQDNTRYISVQVGIGGMQPISAVEVDRVKYGDCKGLSNYTKSLLDAVGVTSYYTHVEAGRYKVDFEDDFASLAEGNHVILAIPYNGEYHWIDCTSQVHPFGFIGDFTDGRKVLVIKPEGGELATTTAYINKDNHQKTTASYAIGADGSISGEVEMETEGIIYDDRFYMENRPADDIKEYYKEYWDNINNLSIDKYEFNNNEENIIFLEKVLISAVNYCAPSGGRILFMPNAFSRSGGVPNRYRNRKLPLEIQRGYFYEDDFAIELPDGYSIEALPNEKNIENEFGSYHMKISVSDDKKSLYYKRSFLVKQGDYPKEKYSEYRDFRKEVSQSDNSKVVLRKK